jgi:hypothetical protein
MRKIHAVAKGAGKWHLGKAMCGCTISRNTPTSIDPSEVTCDRCKTRLVEKHNAAGFVEVLPGVEIVKGTAWLTLPSDGTSNFGCSAIGRGMGTVVMILSAPLKEVDEAMAKVNGPREILA